MRCVLRLETAMKRALEIKAGNAPAHARERMIAVARTLIVAGKFRRPFTVRRRELRTRGDEAYPRVHPYIFVNPVPDPAAFD